MRLTGENIVLDRRYRGPLDSANGGYTAGRLAAYVEGAAAAVRLLLPPPLDRPLPVARDGRRVLLLDGEAVIAEATPVSLALELPTPVSLDEAADAARGHVRFQDERFSECFVCGVRPGDGLCIHVCRPGAGTGAARGALEGTRDRAGDRLGGDRLSRRLRRRRSGSGGGRAGTHGRRAAPAAGRGEECVVLAWPLGEDGRKLFAGTALYGADRSPLALARQTWIQPRTP